MGAQYTDERRLRCCMSHTPSERLDRLMALEVAPDSASRRRFVVVAALGQRRELLILELAILSEQKTAKVIQLLEEVRRDNPLIHDRVE